MIAWRLLRVGYALCMLHICSTFAWRLLDVCLMLAWCLLDRVNWAFFILMQQCSTWFRCFTNLPRNVRNGAITCLASEVSICYRETDTRDNGAACRIPVSINGRSLSYRLSSESGRSAVANSRPMVVGRKVPLQRQQQQQQQQQCCHDSNLRPSVTRHWHPVSRH